jgi:tryptophan halogenase
VRRLSFRPAIAHASGSVIVSRSGSSAGFLEPLEASAIVLIELSLRALIDNFPPTAPRWTSTPRRFNALFRYRWDRIVEFLKLHYVLSRRDRTLLARASRSRSYPAAPGRDARIVAEQPPSSWDFPYVDEIFSAESHQYILYGMGFPPAAGWPASDRALAALAEMKQRARTLAAGLPTNRVYLDALAADRLAAAE